jgi:PAS domain S-box-containing protein
MTTARKTRTFMHHQSTDKAYLDTALEALAADDDWRAALDKLPVPIYTTDCDGNVTYWNSSCVEFSGREPELGSDQWCVTWQLFTTCDEPLPHEQCPMAVAIREQREIRGKVAIAARPDGSRKAFTPYPTPLFDRDGKFHGAVNMLIDISTSQMPLLAEQAKRCRRLAYSVNDRAAGDVLRTMAEGYERNAAALAA